jgi:O6-methylguanine-DNA--protein-cysteine methyltransferase
VIKNDGSVSGYRWGVDRKLELLEREKDANQHAGLEY